MSDIKLPPELVDAVKKNELIVFVGAGLSFNLLNIKNQKLEGWANLVHQILIHLKNKGFDVDYLIPLLGKCEPIEVLRLMEKDKSSHRREIVDFTKDFFDLHETDNDYSLHKSLFELSRKIITTNYDTSFERAVPELRKNIAYKGKNYELARHKDLDAPLLFKLHGCYENAGTMVLFPSGYSDLYNNLERDADHAILVLRNMIINKTILFIGSGMGDFQINNIFSGVQKLQGDYNQKHFIISRNTLDSKLGFLTPIYIKEFKEIKTIIDKLIQIKQEIANQKSPETIILETQLKETEVKLKEMQDRIVENESEMERKDRLLERESLKYFSEGLGFHLKNKFEKAIEMYHLAVELNPEYSFAYNNWGNAVYTLARLKNIEGLYQESIEQCQKAIKLNPEISAAYNNLGNALAGLGELNKDKSLYQASIKQYEKAIELEPKYSAAYNNLGNALAGLGELNKDESLYQASIEQYQKAIKLDPNYDYFYINLGNALYKLAELKKDEDLYQASIEQYEKVTQSDTQYMSYAYNNWGNILFDLAKLKNNAKFYTLSLEKYQKAIELHPNYSMAYNNLGTVISSLAKLKNDKELYKLSFEKYQSATQLSPENSSFYDNWGTAISNLGKLTNNSAFFEEALGKYKKAADLNGKNYNLACIYALKRDKESALLFLENSLNNNENTLDFIKNDEDWEGYLNDPDFLNLLEKYSK